jgi:hypothetical protein
MHVTLELFDNMECNGERPYFTIWVFWIVSTKYRFTTVVFFFGGGGGMTSQPVPQMTAAVVQWLRRDYVTGAWHIQVVDLWGSMANQEHCSTSAA